MDMSHIQASIWTGEQQKGVVAPLKIQICYNYLVYPGSKLDWDRVTTIDVTDQIHDHIADIAQSLLTDMADGVIGGVIIGYALTVRSGDVYKSDCGEFVWKEVLRPN